MYFLVDEISAEKNVRNLEVRIIALDISISHGVFCTLSKDSWEAKSRAPIYKVDVMNATLEEEAKIKAYALHSRVSGLKNVHKMSGTLEQGLMHQISQLLHGGLE